jgi:transcriptional regulator with XRE-family HTH domain
MGADGNSYLGLPQSRLATGALVAFPPVETRRSKKDKGPSLLRAHLAQNVSVLRDRHRRYKVLPNATARNKALAKDADVSPSQIHRIIKADLGASIDIVERIATALEVRPQDLLTPYFVHPAADVREITGQHELRRR